MAVSTSSYFSNSIQGVPQVGSEGANIFEAHSSPRFPIGFKLERADGNVYRYSHFGADVNRGVIVATDVSESGYVDTDNVVVAPASAQTTTDGTSGYKFVEITLASVTADQFAGGYFIVTDDTGEGYTYRIKGNTATDDPATGNFRLELYEKLQATLSATSDFAIVGCRQANLEIATAATDIGIAGVTCSTMDVSAAAYGWIQTKGVVGILQDNTVAIGDNVCISDSINGAVKKCDSVSDEQMVGTCLVAGDSTGAGAFYIDLE